MGSMEWASGETITASALQDMIPILKVKTSATSRASTTTVTADPDLVLTLRPNVTYLCTLSISAIGDAAGDIDIAYSVTGTVTETPLVGRVFRGMADGGGNPASTSSMRTDGAVTSTITTEQTYGVHATSRNNITETFVVSGGASGGTISLVWAQNVSNVTATQVTRGTFLAVPVNLL